MKLRLSYSRTSTFLHCKAAYRWAYIEGLTPRVKAMPLQIGDIVHQLFHLQFEGKITKEDVQNLEEFVKKNYPANDPLVNLQVALEAATLFSGYLNNPEYQQDPIIQTSSEVHLELEMPNFILYGRLDGICKTKDDKQWRLERKTTKMMDSYFLTGLKKSLQAGIYDFLAEKNSLNLTGTIYDILVKTKIPQYKRNLVLKNRKAIERAIQTVEGVCRDIQRGDFYPSSNCINYNRECDYSPLCNFDSEETRKAFFQKIPERERR